MVCVYSNVFLEGNVINIQTGQWVGAMSGVGAGLDSFFEYLLKVKPSNCAVYTLGFSQGATCKNMSRFSLTFSLVTRTISGNLRKFTTPSSFTCAKGIYSPYSAFKHPLKT